MAEAVTAVQRLALGHLTITDTTTVASLTEYARARGATIQADGGTLRIRLDGVDPTATTGIRLDDGVLLNIDSNLSLVRVLGSIGVRANVAYFDKP